MSDGNIQAARAKLAHAVQKLTGPRPAVYHDTTVYVPSLWQSLVSELGGGQGDDRSPAKSQPPVWIDAMQLIVEIEDTSLKWCPKPGSTEHRLQSLSFQTWRPQDTEHVHDMARKVNGWCEQIINLLEPESRKYITDPCPRCGREKVWRKDGGGDTVQQPALEVRNTGCTCLHCKAHWPPERFLFLTHLLGYDLPEGVVSE